EHHSPVDVAGGPKLVMILAELWPSYQEQYELATRAADWCEAHPTVKGEGYAYLLGPQAGTAGGNKSSDPMKGHPKAVEISRSLGPSLAGKDALMRNLRMLSVNLEDPEEARLLFEESEILAHDLLPQYPPDQQLADLGWSAGTAAYLAKKQGRYED